MNMPHHTWSLKCFFLKANFTNNNRDCSQTCSLACPPASSIIPQKSLGLEKVPSTFQTLIVRNLHLVPNIGEEGHRADARGWGEVLCNNWEVGQRWEEQWLPRKMVPRRGAGWKKFPAAGKVGPLKTVCLSQDLVLFFTLGQPLRSIGTQGS